MRLIPLLLSAIVACSFANAQESTGLLMGTHAAITKDDGESRDLYRKDVGFVPVDIHRGHGPDFDRLASRLLDGWGDPDAAGLQVQAISLGIDVIHVDEEHTGHPDTIKGTNGQDYAYVTADVDENHGWLALQFTVEADVSEMDGAPVVIKNEGADAPRAIFCYVFPGSHIEGVPMPSGITRSLSGEEMGIIDSPIAAFNAHLAFYLLGEELEADVAMLSHALPDPEGDVNVYLTFQDSKPPHFMKNQIYVTTFSEGTWSTPAVFLSASEVGLEGHPEAHIDGLAVDAVDSADVKVLFSVNVPEIAAGYPSELMYIRAGVMETPRIYAAITNGTDPKVKPVSELLGNIPLGDFCDRDPFGFRRQGGTSMRDLFLDDFMVASRFTPDTWHHRRLSANGLRTVTATGAPAMATFCVLPPRIRPKTVMVRTWIEMSDAGLWEPVPGTDREDFVPGIAGRHLCFLRPFHDLDGPAEVAPGANRRMVAQWSFMYGTRRYSSHEIALRY